MAVTAAPATGPGPSTAPERPLDPAPSGHRRRRSRRDIAVDVQAIVLAAATGAVFIGVALAEDPLPDAVVLLDIAVLLAACALLWWRRRWPVAVAVPLLLAGSYLDGPGVAALIAFSTVAVHRRTRTLAWVALLAVVTSAVYAVLRPVPDMPLWTALVAQVVLLLAIAGWGTAVRNRRALLDSWRERAVRAEAEQHRRVDQARQVERTRIAREMHDVLAHRISLISMHAGALEYRPDATPEQVAAAAAVVRETSHQALEDLRAVLGVLRSTDVPAPGAGVEPPQPSLEDLPALVAECRRAGLRVEMSVDVPSAAAVPVQLGRTGYRVVQEGLTNARKHAPGTRVEVTVDGAPGHGLSVRVRNQRALGGGVATAPGSGTGLVGLAERAALAGGTLEAGWHDDVFVLAADLPWPAA